MSKLSKFLATQFKFRVTRSTDLLSARFKGDSDWPTKCAAESQTHFFEMLAEGMKSKRLKLVKQACPCGQTTHNTVIAQRDRYALQFDSVLCDACGTVRLDPYFDDQSLEYFYADIYQGLYARAIEPAAYFERQVAYGAKICESAFGSQPGNGRSVLEIGCGAGGGLSVLSQNGFKVRGCDYSAELIEFGTSKRVPGLAVGPVDVIASSKEKFDLIYLHHVFEHVGRPLPTLRSIQNLLKPDGRLLIIVPDLGRVHLYVRAKSDPMKFIHVAHKYNYTLTCFEQLARKTRFEARLFEPSDAPTAWNDAPELWVELSRSNKSQQPRLSRAEFKGSAMLQYLKRTEASFLARTAKKPAKSA